jgi:hypothetical protein
MRVSDAQLDAYRWSVDGTRPMISGGRALHSFLGDVHVIEVKRPVQ